MRVKMFLRNVFECKMSRIRVEVNVGRVSDCKLEE